MSKQSLNTLKAWFQKGLKPLEQQFWHWMDSFYHKDEDIPSTSISGLQSLLDGKMDKKATVTTDQVGVYDPEKDYTYDAANAEYVSFSNASSEEDQYKNEGFYRLKEDAPAGENPETHPAHWAYQGTTIGEITIEDVVGLTEALENSGDKSFTAAYSFSGIDNFSAVFGRRVNITNMVKADNITELRVGKNGASPAAIELPFLIAATDILEFKATYSREEDSYFTLIGEKV